MYIKHAFGYICNFYFVFFFQFSSVIPSFHITKENKLANNLFVYFNSGRLFSIFNHVERSLFRNVAA